jgi:predicted nucleic acid-binding protein
MSRWPCGGRAVSARRQGGFRCTGVLGLPDPRWTTSSSALGHHRSASALTGRIASSGASSMLTEIALAAPVRLELLSGASRKGEPGLRRVLSALPLLVPDARLWPKLQGWVERANRAGERFGAMDLLIAGIADDHRAKVWSRDADFAPMARLGLVQCHAG